MTSPRYVTLLSQKVPVRRAQHIQLGEEHEHAMAFGLYEGSGPFIILAEGQGPDRERHTFLHENLHLMWDLSGLSDEDVEEEDAVSRLAPLLLSWLRSNPKALAYLLEKSA